MYIHHWCFNFICIVERNLYIWFIFVMQPSCYLDWSCLWCFSSHNLRPTSCLTSWGRKCQCSFCPKTLFTDLVCVLIYSLWICHLWPNFRAVLQQVDTTRLRHQSCRWWPVAWLVTRTWSLHCWWHVNITVRCHLWPNFKAVNITVPVKLATVTRT